jgi:hypothetical protein
MTALLHSIYSWLHNHESLALWLEGIALVLILVSVNLIWPLLIFSFGPTLW